MFRYILRKLLLTIPLLWGVITLIFMLVELSPGDVASKFVTPDTTPEVYAMIVEKYGLDKPWWQRYLLMLKNLAIPVSYTAEQGLVLGFDFGVSMVQERPVFDIIKESLPNTLLLSMVTMVVIFPTGILLGTTQGIQQGNPADTGISVISLFFYSMPSFWLALMLQLVFALWWGVLPSSGLYNTVMYDYMTFSEKILDRAMHLILPGIAMGLASAAGTARYMRSSLLEVIRQDYVRTARAKGLPERTVVGKHAIRNALLPIITLMGLSLPFLFSGSVLVETIFAWPGMGRTIVTAIFSQDTPVIIACFFVFTLVVVAGNLIADIAYALVDPRIRYS